MAKVSGKSALAEIDKALQAVRGQLTNVDAEFGSTRSALARLRTTELGLYAELAKLRLVAIEQGDVVDTLDEADRRATSVLEQRAAAEKKLNEDIESANFALGDKERQRGEQQAVVDQASVALDEAEAKAQAALAVDAAYQEQLARTDQADFVADQAEEKAAAAEADRLEKGRPYEDDALFAYLWARGYGTSQYRAFPLTRWLDGKVARLVDYEPARQNYALLIEIPVRLKDHAGAMRALFDAEAGKLADLEEAAGDAAGVPECRAGLEAAEEKLAGIDADIAADEDRLRGLVSERVAFGSGKDKYYASCLEILSEALGRKSIAFLRERAARTPDRRDDEIVRELEALEDEEERIERNLEQYGRLHDNESGKLNELEDLRRRFKSERFDDSFSEFKDWALIALVLNQFLGGGARSSDVWKTIRRQQRMRHNKSKPDFGSLRFPKAPKHGPWRMPKGGFGGLGKGGGFGGGGFKTGGGFRRGGGFKTGGGF